MSTKKRTSRKPKRGSRRPRRNGNRAEYERALNRARDQARGIAGILTAKWIPPQPSDEQVAWAQRMESLVAALYKQMPW